MNTKLIEHFKLGLFERNSHKILKQIEVELNNHNYGVAINLIENILLEVEEDDSWMERLWGWADENNINKNTIPRIATELTQLTELCLQGNELNELPKEIGQLPRLTQLILKGNELKKWPKEIGQLTRLTTLYLKDNELNKLPKEIGQLIQLTELCLHDNNLGKLPKEIESLKKIATLIIDSLPLSKEHFEWIRELKMNGCEVDDGIEENLLSTYTTKNIQVTIKM
jgi:Leucine-rich repeat (LRR) protein